MTTIFDGGIIADSIAFASTAPFNTDTCEMRPYTAGFTLMLRATQAGNYRVLYKDFRGTANQVTASTALSASTPVFVSYDYRLPSVYVEFTPSAATAGTFYAECWCKGAQ